VCVYYAPAKTQNINNSLRLLLAMKMKVRSLMSDNAKLNTLSERFFVVSTLSLLMLKPQVLIRKPMPY
ncbi:unnamed protein product, partial [Ranitomeya imitator]